jgi:hypothetical protein
MARRKPAAGSARSAKVGTEESARRVRECEKYRGELARHRVLTADGQDYVVATSDERHLNRAFETAAYPVSRGYLVMMRQPLCVLTSQDAAAALSQHELLVRVLADIGTGVVRARRRSAAWRRAERWVRGERLDEFDDLDLRDLAASPQPTRPAEVPA